MINNWFIAHAMGIIAEWRLTLNKLFNIVITTFNLHAEPIES